MIEVLFQKGLFKFETQKHCTVLESCHSVSVFVNIVFDFGEYSSLENDVPTMSLQKLYVKQYVLDQCIVILL